VNASLCSFYRDLAILSDAAVFLEVSTLHLKRLDVQKQLGQELFVDFLSCCLTPTTLILFCAPYSRLSSSLCTFSKVIIPKIEEIITNFEDTHNVISILILVLRHLPVQVFQLIIPGLSSILKVYGSHTNEIAKELLANDFQNMTDLIFPFQFALFIFSRIDMDGIKPEEISFLNLILKVANKGIGLPNIKISIGQSNEPLGYTRNVLARSGLHEHDIILNTEIIWKRIAWAVQLQCLRLISVRKTVEIFNHILIPSHDVKIAASLLPRLNTLTLSLLKEISEFVFSDPFVRTYKLFKFIVRGLTKSNVNILTYLWKKEQEIFHSPRRSTAFFIRSLYRLTHRKNEPHRPLDDRILKLVIGTPLESLTREFAKLWKAVAEMSRNDENCHEFLVDHIVELANFFYPSPDCRVRCFLDLGQLHSQHAYASESVVAQLTAAALVAEVLACLEKLPTKGFSDPLHPAKSFLQACLSVQSECEYSDQIRQILEETPNIRGFCDSKYFCECGLIYIIQTSIEACKRAGLFELSMKIHSLLRPLAENRHLWKVLGKHFQNGAMAWTVLAQVFGSKELNFVTYYRIHLESVEVFIYRETKLANLWTVNEKMKLRAAVIAGGKTVKVENEGDNLDQSKRDPEIFRVHV
jgi:hypothetical protein